MITVTYSNTHPEWRDTIAITKQKILQVKNTGEVNGNHGPLIVFPNTNNDSSDTKLITLQKYLEKLQS